MIANAAEDGRKNCIHFLCEPTTNNFIPQFHNSFDLLFHPNWTRIYWMVSASDDTNWVLSSLKFLYANFARLVLRWMAAARSERSSWHQKMCRHKICEALKSNKWSAKKWKWISIDMFNVHILFLQHFQFLFCSLTQIRRRWAITREFIRAHC